MDLYTPAATASRSATMSLGDGANSAILEHIKESARIVLNTDSTRFWIPGGHNLSFGTDAMIEVGGLFSGGVIAELSWGEGGHVLTKKKGLATCKHNGKGTKSAQLKPGDGFQVGNVSFVYDVPGY